MITQERLKELFQYDADTGHFTRILITTNSAKLGEIAGNIHPKGYRYLRIDNKKYFAHRLAWLYVHGNFPEDQIDHINGNRDDNRISNLRVVDQATNSQNKRKPRKGSKSGYLGVTFVARSSKWKAQLRTTEKYHYLGLYNTPEEAHTAYVLAKRKLHPGCTI